MPPEIELQTLRKASISTRYVGFIDVLGFADRVERDFEAALEFYDLLIAHIEIFARATPLPGVTLRVLSDSILLVAPQLAPVLIAANLLHQGSLMCDCLVRGAIASGQHCEVAEEDNLYMVSQALVRAARLERQVGYPCVALHPGVQLPQEALAPAPSNFARIVLFYDGRWIVNPFNITWGTSAAFRVRQLKQRHPEFADKYDWFLALYEAVRSGARLLPSDSD